MLEVFFKIFEIISDNNAIYEKVRQQVVLKYKGQPMKKGLSEAKKAGKRGDHLKVTQDFKNDVAHHYIKGDVHTLRQMHKRALKDKKFPHAAHILSKVQKLEKEASERPNVTPILKSLGDKIKADERDKKRQAWTHLKPQSKEPEKKPEPKKGGLLGAIKNIKKRLSEGQSGLNAWKRAKTSGEKAAIEHQQKKKTDATRARNAMQNAKTSSNKTNSTLKQIEKKFERAPKT
jgi:hypothetical protein